MDLKEIAKKIEQREREIADLRNRLGAIRKAEKELQEAFVEYDALHGARPLREQKVASPTQAILDQAYAELSTAEKHEVPMLSGAILLRLEESGIVVGGQNPSANLSAKLGRDERFQSHGRGKGWSAAVPEEPNPKIEPRPIRFISPPLDPHR